MDEYHVLLKKQIKKVCTGCEMGTATEAICGKILEVVNKTYYEFDKDKKLLERSIDISSREYIENVEKMKKLQSQLIHQEKMAGIGQLSAGIAHEINNPLGFLQSNMETLGKYLKKMQGYFDINMEMMDHADPITIEEYKEYLIKMDHYMKENKLKYIISDLDDILIESLNGIQRIEKIVKSLLGFSRKGFESEFIEDDLNKCIKDTLTIANNEIKYCARVEEILESIPLIPILSGEINQVLLNLIINAAHAIKSKEKQGTIIIHTYCDEKFVYCEISDDGVGIKEEHLKKIFEPFFTTKPVGTGTGLGLSVAHDIIVNKHKGSIEVKSEFGIGTSFKLTLPREREG